jgi:hypothetical protein
MATAQFYVIYIKRLSSVTFDQVKEQMNRALDWYRLEESTWIVYTTSDAEKWYARLSPLAKDSGSLFICKLDIASRQGWMNKDFWSWLRRE